MTITELVTTLAILGLMTVVALPNYTGIQARQALKAAQGGVQSMLYKLQELSLAPSQLPSDTSVEIVGYGLYFYRQSDNPSAGYPRISGCQIKTKSDFITLYRFVRPQDSSTAVTAEPNFLPLGATSCNQDIVPEREANNFYVLPRSVRLSEASGVSFPWMVTQPLQSVGGSLGDLGEFTSENNPLANAAASARVVLSHKTVRIGVDRDPLTRFVAFSRDSNGVIASTGVQE